MIRDYKDFKSYEIRIEMNNGEIYTIIGESKPRMKGKCKMLGDYIPLYTDEEMERRGMDKCPLLQMPYGDMEVDMSNGFVTFKKNDKIAFMERRDLIKSFATFMEIEDEMVDLGD